MTSEVAIALSQHGTVSPSIIHQRVGFATSMTGGRTVMEIQGQKRASEEIAELWTYLEERLNKTFGKKVRLPFGKILTAASRAFGYGQARAGTIEALDESGPTVDRHFREARRPSGCGSSNRRLACPQRVGSFRCAGCAEYVGGGAVAASGTACPSGPRKA